MNLLKALIIIRVGGGLLFERFFHRHTDRIHKTLILTAETFAECASLSEIATTLEEELKHKVDENEI